MNPTGFLLVKDKQRTRQRQAKHKLRTRQRQGKDKLAHVTVSALVPMVSPTHRNMCQLCLCFAQQSAPPQVTCDSNRLPPVDTDKFRRHP